MFPLLNYTDSTVSSDVVINDIARVLEMIQISKVEIPFIWTYRKSEYKESLFTRDHLWKIHDLDERYFHLHAKCSQISEWMDLANVVNEEAIREARDLVKRQHEREKGLEEGGLTEGEEAKVVENEMVEEEEEEEIIPIISQEFYQALGQCVDEESAKCLQFYLSNVVLPQSIVNEVEKRQEAIKDARNSNNADGENANPNLSQVRKERKFFIFLFINSHSFIFFPFSCSFIANKSYFEKD